MPEWFCLYLYFERWCKPFQQEDANFIFGDQARKQSLFNFSHAYTTDLGTIFIITPSYASICSCNFSSEWDYEIVRNLPRVHVGLFSLVTKHDCGAPLLGLAKSIYYIEGETYIDKRENNVIKPVPVYKQHYVYIKDFNSLVFTFTNDKTKKYFCMHCLQCFYSDSDLEEWLRKLYCYQWCTSYPVTKNLCW